MHGYESLVVRKEQNVGSFKKVRARGRKRLAFGWFVCSNKGLYTQLITLFAICQGNQTQGVLYFSLARRCFCFRFGFGLRFCLLF